MITEADTQIITYLMTEQKLTDYEAIKIVKPDLLPNEVREWAEDIVKALQDKQTYLADGSVRQFMYNKEVAELLIKARKCRY